MNSEKVASYCKLTEGHIITEIARAHKKCESENQNRFNFTLQFDYGLHRFWYVTAFDGSRNVDRCILQHSVSTISAALPRVTDQCVSNVCRSRFPWLSLLGYVATSRPSPVNCTVGKRHFHRAIKRPGLLLLALGAGKNGCQPGRCVSSTGTSDSGYYRTIQRSSVSVMATADVYYARSRGAPRCATKS